MDVIERKMCPLHLFYVPSALILGVIGRKNGLYQTIVQYAQQGEQMFVVQYGENYGYFWVFFVQYD